MSVSILCTILKVSLRFVFWYFTFFFGKTYNFINISFSLDFATSRNLSYEKCCSKVNVSKDVRILYSILPNGTAMWMEQRNWGRMETSFQVIKVNKGIHLYLPWHCERNSCHNVKTFLISSGFPTQIVTHIWRAKAKICSTFAFEFFLKFWPF